MSPGEPEKPSKSILLSPVESYFWRFEQEMDGALRVAVIVRLDGHIEADPLALALAQLLRRHPKLRAVITEGFDGRLHYRFDQVARPIPFEIIDCEGVETPWREMTRRLFHLDLQSSGSLAAVIVLRNPSQGYSELLLTAPHAIADGMSGIMLMDDLLTEYAKAETYGETGPCPSLPVVTAPHAKPSAGLRGRFRLFRRFLRLKRQEGRSPVTSLPEDRDIPPQSQWVHWVFSKEQTLTLVRRCRSERTSLTGALVAAACCGIRDCLPAPELLLKWQIPFNIRAQLEGSAGPVSGNDLGCFVSSMNGLTRIIDQPLYWDVARSAHQEVQTFMEEGGLSFGYNTSSMLYGLHVIASRLFTGRVRRVANMTRPDNKRETLLATHYGVLNIRDSYGSLRPKECTLMFKNEITGPSLVMEGLILGQRLNVGFAADDLDQAFWEKLHIAVQKHLAAAMQAGSPISEPAL